MPQESLQLRVVTRLLAAIISQDRNRDLADRVNDIRHSFEVADELIRRCEGCPPAGDLTLAPKPNRATREAVIQREPAPLGELLAERRGPLQPKKRQGPTFH